MQVVGFYSMKYPVCNATCVRQNSFGLSHEDAKYKVDIDDWRLRIKGQPAKLGLPGKWLLNRCTCVLHSGWKFLASHCQPSVCFSELIFICFSALDL